MGSKVPFWQFFKFAKISPEMAGKVRLAIKRQELARNMIKIGKKIQKTTTFFYFLPEKYLTVLSI